MRGLLELFHDVSPYEGFDPAPYPEDVQGWGSRDPVFAKVIAALRPEIIVEVGSWKGASAIHMADIVRDLGLDTTILCVDTWLGSIDHHTDVTWGHLRSLRPRHGYPQLYYTFLGNVVRAGHAGRIVPLPMTSEDGAKLLVARGVRPDLAYIDAAHDEEPALRDFRAYWAAMEGRGVLMGDDYIGWRGVTKAALRFAREIGRPFYGKLGKFVLSADPRLETRLRRDGGLIPRPA